MKDKKRIVYVISETRDYMTNEYKKLMKKNNAKLKKGSAEILKAFIEKNKKSVQLDTETNVTDRYNERELYVIQLGDIQGDVQIVIDFLDISADIKNILLGLFKSKTNFYCQNGKFEYTVIYKHFKVYIKNFVDTMLASQLLSAGLDTPKGFNGLAGMLERTLGVVVSKEEQTTFTTEQMTPSQLVYAAADCIYLGQLMAYMMPSLKRWKLLKVFKLENKTIRPLGDMTINGIEIDVKALDENIILFEKNAADLKALMIEELIKSRTDKIAKAYDNLKIIQPHDEIIINWRSSVQKRLILNMFYKDEHNFLSSSVKALKDAKKLDIKSTVIDLFLEKKHTQIENILINRKMDFLVESGLMIKRGNININFDSPSQLLKVFKLWYPDLDSVGVKALKRLKNPIVTHYKNYAKAQKLCSSFGSKMYDFIEKDGKIHTHIKQLVPSGSRISSSKPNQQQAPSTEQYRRIFIPGKGRKLVDSDYSSAELVLAAYLSNDKKMLGFIKNKQDLHGSSAYQIFGDKWLEAGGDKIPKGKPKTKEASNMRKKAKGCSFSIKSKFNTLYLQQTL